MPSPLPVLLVSKYFIPTPEILPSHIKLYLLRITATAGT
ncbi:hypothetical protein ABOM_012254 [Aspergillus bombycis]|uniref:Uncharacterized protein n=1 Tax=Aspergillus bombycis TaxID=109264 RepID=A0A1F7ZI62_9EURO|nr:hypothetical protein ABOM_012254 [Aspergillus bombycis]OGM39140.1 hypothetical protein ABOM_012254 [Aspergillus bombycis]